MFTLSFYPANLTLHHDPSGRFTLFLAFTISADPLTNAGMLDAFYLLHLYLLILHCICYLPFTHCILITNRRQGPLSTSPPAIHWYLYITWFLTWLDSGLSTWVYLALLDLNDCIDFYLYIHWYWFLSHPKGLLLLWSFTDALVTVIFVHKKNYMILKEAHHSNLRSAAHQPGYTLEEEEEEDGHKKRSTQRLCRKIYQS